MIECPDQNAPRIAWHLYVFERVAPIVAAHDAEFADLIDKEQPLVSWIRREVETPGSIPDTVAEMAQTAFAQLLAKAQATFDWLCILGDSQRDALWEALSVAFSPLVPWTGPGFMAAISRWWWEFGLPGYSPRDAYFAPGGRKPERMCEAIYHQERNRRLLGPEVLAAAQEQALNDTAPIQRAAGIGLFQSGPEDSEGAESDTEGISEAAGIGLFQTSVPRVRKTSTE